MVETRAISEMKSKLNRSKAQVNGTEIMDQVCHSFGKPGQTHPDPTQFDYRHNFGTTNMKYLSPER